MKNLRAIRRARGWTQERLSEASGITVEAIASNEAAYCPQTQFHIVIRLADGLGCTLDELCGRTVHEPDAARMQAALEQIERIAADARKGES